MSSRRSGKPYVAGSTSNYQLFKEKNVPDVSTQVDQLSKGVAGVNINSLQNNGEKWGFIARKPMNKAGSSLTTRPSVPKSSNPKWGQSDVVSKPGRWSNAASGKGSGNAGVTRDAIRPPLQNGWNWKARVGSGPSKVTPDVQVQEDDVSSEEIDYEDADDDDDMDDTDEELFSDEYNSDASQKSHDTRKNIKWFKSLFDSLDRLTVEQINDPERHWHCPACKGGPGAIDWYRGLMPLIRHAKTKGTSRVKLHRELAELLNEELQRRGTSAVQAGEAYGQWKGLKEEEKDHQIIWPPMVVIMNTKLDKDDNDKWIGMGNQELLDYFSQYAALRARHSYGPQGHRGMSILIFEGSAIGFLEAERLDKHFSDQGNDKDAWNHRRILFLPGGKRQLYGFMATKEDLDWFNQHSQGKTRLKFELRSYQEMVVRQIKQMSEDNQQLLWIRNRYSREKMHSKALQDTLGMVTKKLRETAEEYRIVRQRTKNQHLQNKAEMDFQDQFFKEQIKVIHQARDAKEEDFEKLQQQEREKVKQSTLQPVSLNEYESKGDEISRFIEIQTKEMEGFAAERDRLVEKHEMEIGAMRRRHYEEEVELEKEFDEKLANLMGKYTPDA